MLPLLQQSFKIRQVGVSVDPQDFLGLDDGNMGYPLLLSHRGIRLIFLNACETGAVGKRRFNSGLTSALVESGIPAGVMIRLLMSSAMSASLCCLERPLGRGHRWPSTLFTLA